ncbi:hypothetical protein BV22DRAFT_1023926 [Leucogyrophana mollusca]|uniref:Uncharacterized protein n=1 Tax=Leucogyrophana mollusca TaxID=85980 RepID=A0ACB8B173_9AGAM|nr:hypothetical protein BV22DRAFT_1023926 [Leucogyrophana mollusca]
MLQEEIPHITVPYINDVPIKGPATAYLLEDGSPEVLTNNPGIKRFVFEHFNNLNCVVQWMQYCRGTFLGFKVLLCVTDFLVVGHRCTPEGQLPDKS